MVYGLKRLHVATQWLHGRAPDLQSARPEVAPCSQLEESLAEFGIDARDPKVRKVVGKHLRLVAAEEEVRQFADSETAHRYGDVE